MAITKLTFKDGYDTKNNSNPVDYISKENSGTPLTGDDLQSSQARLAAKANEIIDEIESVDGKLLAANAYIQMSVGDGLVYDHLTNRLTIDRKNLDFLGFVNKNAEDIIDDKYTGDADHKLYTTNHTEGILVANIKEGQYFEVTNSKYTEGATYTKQIDSGNGDIWFVSGFVKSLYVSKSDYDNYKADIVNEFSRVDGEHSALVTSTDNNIKALIARHVQHDSKEEDFEKRIKAEEDATAKFIQEDLKQAGEIQSVVESAKKNEDKNTEQDGRLDAVETKSNTNESDLIKAKKDIIDAASVANGHTTSKQNRLIGGVSTLKGEEVEKVLVDNHNSIELIKDNEKTFVTKKDGVMEDSYNPTNDSQVVVKKNLDTEAANRSKQYADLLTSLSQKADKASLGSTSLIWIPNNDSTGTEIKGVVDATAKTITYTFGTRLKTWMDAQQVVSFNGKDTAIRLHNSVTSVMYLGEDAYGNKQETISPFNGDVSAEWKLEEDSLIIKTDNIPSEDTAITQIGFEVQVAQGGNTDIAAHNEIDKLKISKQDQSIIIDTVATTVEAQLTSNKADAKAIDDRTKGISKGATGIEMSGDLNVHGELKAKSIKIDDKNVAMDEDIVPIINVDGSRTVKAVIDDIQNILVNQGRATVQLDHDDTTQSVSKYIGTAEIIDNDPLASDSLKKAYFLESNYNKFTDSDTVEKWMFQDILNVKGYNALHGTTKTEAEFFAMTIKEVRREIPVSIKEEHVIVGSTDLKSEIASIHKLITDNKTAGSSDLTIKLAAETKAREAKDTLIESEYKAADDIILKRLDEIDTSDLTQLEIDLGIITA